MALYIIQDLINFSERIGSSTWDQVIMNLFPVEVHQYLPLVQKEDPGSSIDNPIHMDELLKDDEEDEEPMTKEDKYIMNLLKMIAFVWWSYLGVIITMFPAFMGDFEAFYWWVQLRNDLLPENLQIETESYYNRYNGVIFGFRNTSYVPPPSNWTTWPDKEEKVECEEDDEDCVECEEGDEECEEARDEGKIKVQAVHNTGILPEQLLNFEDYTAQ